LTAQVNCAYAYAAASHADAWLAEHFQKQNALNGNIKRLARLKDRSRKDNLRTLFIDECTFLFIRR
jgi:hypothetical protein